jgi:hypothetical protein
MRRLFLRGMTGHDVFSIMDVYARARHTGLLDVYKGKPVTTRQAQRAKGWPQRQQAPARRQADPHHRHHKHIAVRRFLSSVQASKTCRGAPRRATVGDARQKQPAGQAR